MRQEAVEKLLEVNRVFYRDFAASFAESRQRPEPGFWRLTDYLPRPCATLLDVGCGEGRLGRFLRGQKVIDRYMGVDFSSELLSAARSQSIGNFVLRDLSEDGCLKGLGQFDAATSLATLQHIPSRASRIRLLAEIAEHVVSGGPVILSTWQFLDSPRQRQKLLDWTEIGLEPTELEDTDYLMAWRRDGYGVRYVCLIDSEEVNAMADQIGATIVDQFRSDGREGDLNLYTILRV